VPVFQTLGLVSGGSVQPVQQPAPQLPHRRAQRGGALVVAGRWAGGLRPASTSSTPKTSPGSAWNLTLQPHQPNPGRPGQGPTCGAWCSASRRVSVDGHRQSPLRWRGMSRPPFWPAAQRLVSDRSPDQVLPIEVKRWIASASASATSCIADQSPPSAWLVSLLPALELAFETQGCARQ